MLSSNEYFSFCREYPEMASNGFIHIDFIGQTHLCYLLPRTGNLLLSRFEKTNASGLPIFGALSSIPAKDAITLNVIQTTDLKKSMN